MGLFKTLIPIEHKECIHQQILQASHFYIWWFTKHLSTKTTKETKKTKKISPLWEKEGFRIVLIAIEEAK